MPGALLFWSPRRPHFSRGPMDGSHVFKCNVVGGPWLATCLLFIVRRLHDIGESGRLLLLLLLVAGISAPACWMQTGIGYAAFVSLPRSGYGHRTGADGSVLCGISQLPWIERARSAPDRHVAYGLWISPVSAFVESTCNGVLGG